MLSRIKSLVPQFVRNWFHFANAAAALIYYQNPAKNLKIIAVTGTDGKTTTSTLIYHLLKAADLKVALISTLAAYIGDRQIDTGFHVTSPDPWALQKLIKEIHAQNFDYLVLEVTSHGLDQHRLLGIKPTLAVLTNITHEHLDYHKTYHNYLMAKAKLFLTAKNSLLNPHDSSYPRLKALLASRTSIATYAPEDLPAPLLQALNTRFPEPYNRQNAAAAIIALHVLGIAPASLSSALTSFPGVPGRMQHLPNNKGINLIVDFAHTPNALKKALESLRPQTKGKLIAVYGAAGLRDHTKRPMMGKVGSELADEVILTAEDPRTESVEVIIRQMLSGATKNISHLHTKTDRQEAINFAVSLAKKGDTIGIFGKGHEQSMCFGTTEYPWSDVQAAEKAIKIASKAKKVANSARHS